MHGPFWPRRPPLASYWMNAGVFFLVLLCVCSFRENLVKTFTDADGKSRGGTGGDYGGAQAGGRRESGQAVGRDEDKMEPGEGDVDKTRRR